MLETLLDLSAGRDDGVDRRGRRVDDARNAVGGGDHVDLMEG